MYGYLLYTNIDELTINKDIDNMYMYSHIDGLSTIKDVDSADDDRSSKAHINEGGPVRCVYII
jgi:hypothetical protein